jgi:hypothetical protein
VIHTDLLLCGTEHREDSLDLEVGDGDAFAACDLPEHDGKCRGENHHQPGEVPVADKPGVGEVEVCNSMALVDRSAKVEIADVERSESLHVRSVDRTADIRPPTKVEVLLSVTDLRDEAREIAEKAGAEWAAVAHDLTRIASHLLIGHVQDLDAATRRAVELAFKPTGGSR